MERLEDLMYDEDWRIRRVGVETLLNMLYCDKVFEMIGTKDGKKWNLVRLFALFSGCPDEDYEAARAAAGCIAILSGSPDVALYLAADEKLLGILFENALCGKPELQTRALYALRAMARTSKEVAEHICRDEGRVNLLHALKLVGGADFRETCADVR